MRRRLAATFIALVLAAATGACTSDPTPETSSPTDPTSTTLAAGTALPPDGSTEAGFQIDPDLLGAVRAAGLPVATGGFPDQPAGVPWPTESWPEGALPDGVNPEVVDSLVGPCVRRVVGRHRHDLRRAGGPGRRARGRGVQPGRPGRDQELVVDGEVRDPGARRSPGRRRSARHLGARPGAGMGRPRRSTPCDHDRSSAEDEQRSRVERGLRGCLGRRTADPRG